MYEIDAPEGGYLLEEQPVMDDKETDVIVLQEVDEDGEKETLQLDDSVTGDGKAKGFDMIPFKVVNDGDMEDVELRDLADSDDFEEGMAVLESLVHDRDILLSNITKLKGIRDYDFNDEARKVVQESAAFRRYLEKRYFGRKTNCFANEAFFYGNSVTEVIATESSESGNIFVRIWNAIKKAFKWLADFVSGIFGRIGSDGSKIEKEVKTCSDKLAEATAKGIDIREIARKVSMSDRDIDQATEEAMAAATKNEHGEEAYEVNRDGTIGIKKGSTLAKSLYIPGMRGEASPSEIVDYFKSLTEKVSTLGLYSVSLYELIQKTTDASLVILNDPSSKHLEQLNIVDLFRKQYEIAEANFEESRSNKLMEKYDLSGPTMQLEDGDNRVCFYIDRLPKDTAFVAAELIHNVGVRLPNGELDNTRILSLVHYSAKAKKDHSDDFGVASLLDKNSSRVLDDYVKRYKELLSKTADMKKIMDSATRRIVTRDSEGLLRVIKEDGGATFSPYAGSILSLILAVEKDSAAAWRNISKVIVDVDRYGRNILRYLKASTSVAEKVNRELEKAVKANS